MIVGLRRREGAGALGRILRALCGALPKRVRTDQRGVDVDAGEHRPTPLIRGLVETRLTRPPRRIAQGAEQVVPERQVAVVVRMQTALMVYAVRFGSLH